MLSIVVDVGCVSCNSSHLFVLDCSADQCWIIVNQLVVVQLYLVVYVSRILSLLFNNMCPQSFFIIIMLFFLSVRTDTSYIYIYIYIYICTRLLPNQN